MNALNFWHIPMGSLMLCHGFLRMTHGRMFVPLADWKIARLHDPASVKGARTARSTNVSVNNKFTNTFFVLKKAKCVVHCLLTYYPVSRQ